MWVFFPNAMLSIVAHRDKPDTLLVRARFRGDIERVLPGVRVTRTPRADYLYRAEVSRIAMAGLLSEHANTMAYANVKGAIPMGDRRRSHAMHDVWQVMFDAQHQAEPARYFDEEPDAEPVPPRLFSGAWFAHTTARGEPRTVHVESVQDRTDGSEPDVTLEFRESGAHYTLPMARAQRWLRNSELLP